MKDELLSKLPPVFGKAGVEFAYLFGSVAKGEETRLSDLDIAVYLGRGRASLDEELALHADLCRALGTGTIDLVVLNGSRNLILLDEIVRSGRLIYDGNRSLREEFELMVLHDAIDFRFQRKVFAGR